MTPDLQLCDGLIIHCKQLTPFKMRLITIAVSHRVFVVRGENPKIFKEHGKSCIWIFYEKYCVLHIPWHS